MDKLHVLIEKYISGKSSKEENLELAELVENIDDQELFDYLKQCYDATEPDETILSKDKVELIFQNIVNHRKCPGKLIRLKNSKWFKVAAAVVIILLGATGLFFYQYGAMVGHHLADQTEVKTDILPGGYRAILKLADGTEIDLDTAENGVLANQANVRVVKLENGKVQYNSSKHATQKIQYNTIATPRGGQYELTLPDSSKVLLNAASSIHFPVAFAENERRVEISGEVYFEVAKMANKPLVVSTGDVDVRVLGTHFIVSAYPDQNLTKTTLLEGSVKVLHGDDSAMLQPGQQARVDKNGKIAIHDDVNLMLESSWIHGIFLFDHFTVPEIMAQISRWYDIEVEYDGDITNKTFSGIVSRKSNISKVLKIMERAGLQFTVDDKKIIVSQ